MNEWTACYDNAISIDTVFQEFCEAFDSCFSGVIQSTILKPFLFLSFTSNDNSLNKFVAWSYFQYKNTTKLLEQIGNNIDDILLEIANFTSLASSLAAVFKSNGSYTFYQQYI